MKEKMKYHIGPNCFFLPILFVFFFVYNNVVYAQTNEWRRIDAGLYVAEFESPQKSVVGDSKITIVKINPAKFQFRLLCAKQLGAKNLIAKEWCEKFDLICCVNAGMFQTDHSTNVGYMKNLNYINNPGIHPKYHSVFAFNPITKSTVQAAIFDIDEHKMDKITKNYNTVIQNLRLIKNPRENRWSKQDKMWSEVALGQDKEGNILFIFSRSPYSMHDFNNILLKLPIEIVNSHHLEGGPEASLYFKYEELEIEKSGSFETNFFESDNNIQPWPIPNVLGFVKIMSSIKSK
jgi:uncharacterized protein YigE (DUF2233 family)